jgi:hypothetical protein
LRLGAKGSRGQGTKGRCCLARKAQGFTPWDLITSSARNLGAESGGEQYREAGQEARSAVAGELLSRSGSFPNLARAMGNHPADEKRQAQQPSANHEREQTRGPEIDRLVDGRRIFDLRDLKD